MSKRRVAIIASVIIILAVVMNSGYGMLTTAKLSEGNRNAEARALEIERGYTIHADFVLTVPAGGESREVGNEAGRCLIRIPLTGEHRALPPAETTTNEKRYWHPYVPGKPFRKIRYLGHALTEEYKIRVQERDGGECDSWK